MSPFFHGGDKAQKIAINDFQGFCRKSNHLCIVPNNKNRLKERSGSSKISTSVILLAFQLPVFYNQQPPDTTSGMTTVQKHRNIRLRCFRTECAKAFDSPEPNLLRLYLSLTHPC